MFVECGNTLDYEICCSASHPARTTPRGFLMYKAAQVEYHVNSNWDLGINNRT